MKEYNNLGNFKSIEEVWERYPNGGVEGDMLYIAGVQYVWNKFDLIWENSDTHTESTDKETINLYEDYVFNGRVRVLGTIDADVRQPNCGLYSSISELKKYHPNPIVGQWACIGNTLPAPIYRCDTPGVWTATGETGGLQSDNDRIINLERDVKDLQDSEVAQNELLKNIPNHTQSILDLDKRYRELREHDQEQDEALKTLPDISTQISNLGNKYIQTNEDIRNVVLALSKKSEGLVVVPIEGISDLDVPITIGSIMQNPQIVYSTKHKHVVALYKNKFFRYLWNSKIVNGTEIPDGSWYDLYNPIIGNHWTSLFYYVGGGSIPLNDDDPQTASERLDIYGPSILPSSYPQLFYQDQEGKLVEFYTSAGINKLKKEVTTIKNSIQSLTRRVESLENK